MCSWEGAKRIKGSVRFIGFMKRWSGLWGQTELVDTNISVVAKRGPLCSLRTVHSCFPATRRIQSAQFATPFQEAAVYTRRLMIAGIVLAIAYAARQSLADGPAPASTDPQASASKTPVWTSMFDGKKPEGWKDSNIGAVEPPTVTDGHLELPMADGISSITWQKEFPKSNYEIRLQAMRIEGNDFFCGLTFPVQKNHCSFIVGGWGGTVVGLSSIDGEDAAHNATMKRERFESAKWYKIRVRVTDHRIQTWIDDKQMVDQPLAGKKISIRPEVGLSKPLGISTWNTSAGLKGIEYRLLSKSEL